MTTGVRLRGGPLAHKPSPYLRAVFDKMMRCGWQPLRKWAIDLGAGNGRNANWLKSMGVGTMAFDPEPGGVNVHHWNGLGFPGQVPGYMFDVILLQYVLMFLDERRYNAMTYTVNTLARYGCVLVLETYQAKDSRYFPTMIDDWVAKLNDYAAHGTFPGQWVVCHRRGRNHVALQFRENV